MSPSPSSGTCACSLPCTSSSWPRRSFACARALTTFASLFSVPLSTRNTLIRPAKGSAIVLKTNAAVPSPSTLIGAPFLRRRRNALDEQVEQRGRAEILRRDAAGDREDLAAGDRVLQARARPPRRRAPARRGSAPSGPRRSPRPRRAASRGTRSTWSGSSAGISVGPPSRAPSGSMYAAMCSRSTMPVSSCSAPIGMCTATQLLRELLAKRLERAEEVGALAVEHVHEDDPREAELLGARPVRGRLHLDAHHRADDERARPRRRAARRSCRPGSPASPGVSIRLILRPCHSRWQTRRRRATSGAAAPPRPSRRPSSRPRRSEPVRRARLEQHRLDERGLSRPAVSDDGDIADLAGLDCASAERPPRTRLRWAES